MKLIRPLIVLGLVIVLVVGGVPTTPKPVARAALTTISVAWDTYGQFAQSEPIEGKLTMVGLTWTASDKPNGVWVRTKVGSRWSGWFALPIENDHEPDPGTDEAKRSVRGSDPLWVGESDAVQFRLSGQTTLDAEAVLIDTSNQEDPGLTILQSLLFPRVPAAQGAPSKPTIRPRSAWDPSGACEPRDEPDEVQVTHFFVHHTTGTNDYLESEVPGRLLGICLFHRNSRGWDDIAYNFLIDKYGNIWEGRAGGVEKGIQGGHTSGFSTYSVGIAFIGDHRSTRPTPAAESALTRLIAWKANVHNVNTSTNTTVVSKGSNKWPQGTPVSLHAISAHLDAQTTSCPGEACYDRMSTYRSRVAQQWRQVPLSKYVSPLVGDFDGDGADEAAIFRTSNGRWVLTETNGKRSAWADFRTAKGWSKQLVGDFNGDGRDDIANFHPSTGNWMVSVSTGSSFRTRKWETFRTRTGWTSLVGDYNGDGRDDIANFHPSTGKWMVAVSTGNSFATRRWETFRTRTGWTSLVGDYNGDGRDDIANFHPSTGNWMVAESRGSRFETRKWETFRTKSGWTSVVGDYDGDGRDDVANFHPAKGNWMVAESSGRGFNTRKWATVPTRDHLSVILTQDVDRNGRDDILTVDAYNGFLWRLRSKGNRFEPTSLVDTPWRTTLGAIAAGPQSGPRSWIFFGQEFRWIRLTNLNSDDASATALSAFPRS